VTPLHEHVAAARRTLAGAGLESADAAFDADLLARHVLGWDRGEMLTRQHLSPPDGFTDRYRDVIARRVAREPVALITGHREFWGLDFEVTRDVLIPRPETEVLVETALEILRTVAAPVVVDVGTGSGCIAVAIAHDHQRARVVAIDRSAAALAVAARNIRRLGADSRVTLVRGNLLDPVRGRADLIVSNPPYVDRQDAVTLQPEVVRYEPGDALFAAEHGLGVLRTLFETAADRLAPDGSLIVEFGAGQAHRLRALAPSLGWNIRTVRDLAGIERVAVLTRAR
jgi:release factor glutamine methyltransferase